MPSGKRETERKGNAPVNTGPSPNSDGRANNLVEEADEPARGSGPLQYIYITFSVHSGVSVPQENPPLPNFGNGADCGGLCIATGVADISVIKEAAHLAEKVYGAPAA
ncbi:hypothetical protein T07_10240 [Trichinella nelsoni]|uniref:Uncharacterized protein n=1 Tax=Trichinella nelsoni TaxID=6336 RepID=A0A0V0RFG7_9BILA|nr:hypothetical protein T07_10240 [Trichinella nelsoni]